MAPFIAVRARNVPRSGIDGAIDTGGMWLGGFLPTAGVLALTSWVNSNKATVQKVVDALVATTHWISTHSAADIANAMPAAFVSNSLITKAEYISALAQDKTQFLPDGMMPAGGPPVVEAIGRTAGTITGSVDLASTYTNSFATTANKLEGFAK